jgi:ribosomal protein L7/L12
MSNELQIIELQKETGDLKRRIARLERTVTFLLDQADVEYVDHPDEGDFSDVRELMYSGKKLEAIKLYREQTGASLAEAQTFVEGV